MKLSLSASLALVAQVQAGLRFGCSTLTIQRLDPIVEPGATPSAHLHHIIGGDAFNATMEGDPAERASCTTCEMSEDFSNYWTAVLYFRDPQNGTYHQVPVKNNAALAAGTTGGMTIYYTQFDLFRDNLAQQPVKAFPVGFRMTVGSPAHSSLADQGASTPGLRYNCLTTLLNRGPEMNELPDRKCAAGIFAIHHFPACWDGKNIDSANHQDHMFGTQRGAFQNAGPCPASHPVRMPQVSYETVWDTTVFNDLWDPARDEQPFSWSFGDFDGFGTHADYRFGWKDDSLQRAMDKSECRYDGCGSIEKQNMRQANQCKVETMVAEEIDGWGETMPGQDPAVLMAKREASIAKRNAKRATEFSA